MVCVDHLKIAGLVAHLSQRQQYAYSCINLPPIPVRSLPLIPVPSRPLRVYSVIELQEE